MNQKTRASGHRQRCPTIVCPYCREVVPNRPGLTDRDHVPPRSFFENPRPQMKTVLCCRPCHEASSNGEEILRLQITANPLRDHIPPELSEVAIRSIERNPWWSKSLATNLDSAKVCDFGFPGIAQKAVEVIMPKDLQSAVDKTIWRIAIGSIFQWSPLWDHRKFSHQVVWCPDSNLLRLGAVHRMITELQPRYVQKVGGIKYVARGFGFDDADKGLSLVVLNFYATCIYLVVFSPNKDASAEPNQSINS